MKRALAHIEIITDIQPIKDADRIETATILGWQCVINKGEFKIGDYVVYCEVDSVLPDKPEFEFLRSRNFRIRTIKLKKQISQGLVLPITVLKNNTKFWDSRIGFFGKIGDDVTDIIGITKYLTPSEKDEISEQKKQISLEQNRLKKFMMRYNWFRRFFLSKKQKNGFPYWVSKTDEERIQNIPKILEQFADKEVYVTEKVDYQSVTFTSKTLPRFNNRFGLWIFNLVSKW